MYLYKISTINTYKTDCTSNLISKILHNWRTHHKSNILYRTTLSKIILLCLSGTSTYMLSSVTELNEMLKDCGNNLSKPQKNIAYIINKIGYTSLEEVTKLSNLFNIKIFQVDVSYDLTINNNGDCILNNKYIIGSRTLEVHNIAIKYSSKLAKLDKFVFQALLTQSRDNDLNSHGVSYASRNKEGTIYVHFPVTADMCMSMGYNFYTDNSTIWAVYYERGDMRFNIVKVNDNYLSDECCVNLKNVKLIKPTIKFL